MNEQNDPIERQREILDALLDLNADALQGETWARIADLMRRAGCSFDAFASWVADSESVRYSGPEPLRAIWDGYTSQDEDRLTVAELQQMAKRWAAHGEADQKAVKDALYRETLRKVNTYQSGDILSSLERGDQLQVTEPTGLATLDKALGGGLRPGLTVLGAFSSLGKTSLCVQLADHIAEHGRAVLFVSIEQHPRELISKSLARIARRLTGRTSFWASDIYDYGKRAAWTPGGPQYADLAKASQWYRQRIEPHLLYCGGEGQPSFADIRAAAYCIRERMGEGAQAPVVIIDYLQLLKPYSENDSDKQTIDRHITNLRQLSAKLNTQVVAISSISRAAYKDPIDMASFKESGAIEFGADVALGLQPLGMRERCKAKGASAGEIIDDCKRQKNRELEITVLKNRGYSMPRDDVSIYFDGETQSIIDRGWASGMAVAEDADEDDAPFV